MKALLLITAALTLAACGARNELTPAKGKALPPAPYGAKQTPTPSKLTEPGPQARPERNDELLRDSEERQDDPFDLPPAR